MARGTGATTRAQEKKARHARTMRILNGVGMTAVAALIIGALYGTFSRRAGLGVPAPKTDGAATRPAQPPVAQPVPVPAPTAPQRTGQPWEHDAATNMHWDPRVGHQHWHAGPPPSEEERQRLMSEGS